MTFDDVNIFLPVFAIFVKLSFFCFPCKFISFNAKEMELCSYTHDKWWVVKRLTCASYCMINCGETGNDISWNFWFSNGWFQADVIFKADKCIILTHNSPSPCNCWVSYSWPVGYGKREEKNDTIIAKPSTHKATGSWINEMIFPSLSWTYFFIN